MKKTIKHIVYITIICVSGFYLSQTTRFLLTVGKITIPEIVKSKTEIIADSLISVLGVDPLKAEWMAVLIKQSSEEFGIEWQKIAATIKVESDFKPFLYSKPTKLLPKELRESAFGLLQIKPATAKEICKELNVPWIGERQLYHPAYSIRFGTYYMSKLAIPLHDDFEAISKAYNVGLGGYYKGFSSEEHWQKVKYWWDKLK